MGKKSIMAACLATVAALGALGLSGIMFMKIRKQNDIIVSLRDAVKRAGEDPDIAVQPPKVYEPTEVDHFYERRGQKILLSDPTYGQIWLPVLSDVPLSTHPVENMVETDKGRVLSFDADGDLNALTGVDLSAHNTITDWAALKADGVDFVMLRAGYRGYGVDTGKLARDTKFREYYHAAKNAGLKVGAYFFSQAITEEEAVEEAILTAQMLEGCELDFPVAYDWELILHDSEGARTDNVPVDVLTDCVLAYCQNMESFGYQTMVYQNKRTTLFKLDMPRLADIPFWLAEYGDGPTYIYDYDMWQYSCTGTVAGVEGNVDLNLCFKDFSQAGKPAIKLPAPEYTPISETTETDENSEDAPLSETADEPAENMDAPVEDAGVQEEALAENES